MRQYIDLSRTIFDNEPTFPGDNPTILSKTNFLENDGFNSYQLTSGLHTGTHLDGPAHMTSSPTLISDMDINSFFGKAIVLNVKNQPIILWQDYYRELGCGCDFLILQTGMEHFYGSNKYYNEYPMVDIAFAENLVELNIKFLGIDSPSPDYHPYAIHQKLLSNNISIIENLSNLDQLPNTRFEIVALPLKIATDSAPVRVIAVL